MTNLRKLAVIVAVITGIIILYALVDRFNQREDLPGVIKTYREKGKNTQFKMEDVRKGFQ